MPSIAYVDNRRAFQYTGSNSAEIDAGIPNFTIASESAGTLTFNSSSPGWVAHTGDWILYTQGVVTGVFSNADFFTFYERDAWWSDLNAINSAITALQTSVAGLGSAALRSAGVQTAPTLLLGIAQNVDVTLMPAMPNTAYTPYSYAFGGVNLSGLTINSTTVISASVVRVNLQTSLVSLAGVHVMVLVKA